MTRWPGQSATNSCTAGDVGDGTASPSREVERRPGSLAQEGHQQRRPHPHPATARPCRARRRAVQLMAAAAAAAAVASVASASCVRSEGTCKATRPLGSLRSQHGSHAGIDGLVGRSVDGPSPLRETFVPCADGRGESTGIRTAGRRRRWARGVQRARATLVASTCSCGSCPMLRSCRRETVCDPSSALQMRRSLVAPFPHLCRNCCGAMDHRGVASAGQDTVRRDAAAGQRPSWT